MVKFAVFGSSVVARLNTFCTGDMKNRGECNCFGLGGMKAEYVFDSLLVKLRLCAPDVVFIHIGANDISKDCSCKTICENIQSLVGEIYKAVLKSFLMQKYAKRVISSKHQDWHFKLIRTLSTVHYRNSLVTALWNIRTYAFLVILIKIGCTFHLSEWRSTFFVLGGFFVDSNVLLSGTFYICGYQILRLILQLICFPWQCLRIQCDKNMVGRQEKSFD